MTAEQMAKRINDLESALKKIVALGSSSSAERAREIAHKALRYAG